MRFLLISCLFFFCTLTVKAAPKFCIADFYVKGSESTLEDIALSLEDEKMVPYLCPPKLDDDKTLSFDTIESSLEIGFKPLEGHETKVIPAQHTKDKTKYSIVLIHGLYVSPKSTQHLAKLYSKLGFHVINIRLSGHFEEPRKKLDTTTWKDWEHRVKQAVKIAQSMGESVILSGHSSGGLLATKVALDSVLNSKSNTPIAGVLNYTPTLKLNTKISSGLNSTTSIFNPIFKVKKKVKETIEEYFSNSQNPIYVSINAGIQVDKLSKHIIDNYSITSREDSEDNEPWNEPSNENNVSDIYKSLINIPVFILDTEKDKISDTKYNENVMQFLKQENSNSAMHIVEKEGCLKHKSAVKSIAGTSSKKNLKQQPICVENTSSIREQLFQFIQIHFPERCL